MIVTGGGALGTLLVASSEASAATILGLDLFLSALVVVDLVQRLTSAKYPTVFLRRHVVDLVLAVVLVGFVVGGGFSDLHQRVPGGRLVVAVAVLSRSGFYALRLFAAMRKTVDFLLGLTAHPAQTIVTSFVVVIVVGTSLLMMPFSGAGGVGLSFLDALFTATSAVCVTGLIVVDTATAFSVAGQIVILALIQIGGLGIIILSYFALFVLRRSVGVEDKLLLAYTLSESDMSRLAGTLRTIVRTTFAIEAVGALLLAAPMARRTSSILETILYSGFHAVSAFCNAGFALFSDSLESFSDTLGANIVFAALIVTGGLSFVVIQDLAGRSGDRPGLMVNTKIVLVTSGILLLTAFFGVYGLEHGRSFADMPTGQQYLAAFFQSVTLRTAGFNTVPFGNLGNATLVFMTVFMIIGGASGSTAGGIKVNTVAVLFCFTRSRVRNLRQTVVFGQAVPEDTISRSILILLFGITACVVFGLVLLISEDAPVSHVLFETASAFGTVGLSAGLTPQLSVAGRLAVIVLMFLGRLGPLTILAAASGRRRGLDVEYPAGQVSIG